MPALVHINDNNILIHKGDQLLRSQGYAWLKNGEVFFDLDEADNAVHHCRLEPQQINSNYWQQCAQTAIPGNASGMRHAADLIWCHLGELQKRQALSDVILVVPSHYQANNLQLLLGICKALGLQVSGVVNKSVLALQQHITRQGRYLHIDVQLHQTVCSEVVAKASSTGSETGFLSLGGIEILHEVGLQSIQDAALRAIQERFILNDRFDPLHYAETEQQLFDRLPALADSIREDGKADIGVNYQGRRHASSIDLKQWTAALKSYVNQLRDADLPLASTGRYYDFNGFQATSFADPNSLNIEQDKSALEYQAKTLAKIEPGDLIDHKGKVIYRTELESKTFENPHHDNGQPERDISESRATQTNNNAESVAQPTNLTVDENSATHLLQSGVAVPIELAQIALNSNLIELTAGTSSNLAELLDASKIFILSDAQRRSIKVDDRLGSDLADGVITAIRVLGSTSSPTLTSEGR